MATIQDFDASINALRALLWRNNEAVNVQALLQFKQDFLNENQEQFWDDWFTDVFDLNTANEFGLAVWSIILAIPLSIDPAPPTNDNSNFGFGQFRKNFNNGNFTDAVNAIILTPEQARLVLKLRFYQIMSKMTVPKINEILEDIFGDLGDSYVLDGLDMTMKYVFLFDVPQAIRLILNKFDLLPRPAGVEISFVDSPNSNFGFGSFRKNFNNGNFRG